MSGTSSANSSASYLTESEYLRSTYMSTASQGNFSRMSSQYSQFGSRASSGTSKVTKRRDNAMLSDYMFNLFDRLKEIEKRMFFLRYSRALEVKPDQKELEATKKSKGKDKKSKK